ncbi:hypothetical protein Rhopal_007024-T1 [Rhodotorula paludigena]|uniref:Uncharacterized protein n=1 Tax=Rhodotorula paludigena TaxID=86838 RepID=A0AAV5GUR4_9BASI|nr:hypothetical protein Rhopal_007024-T1 [Rhodotorula paludigena]
MSAGDARNVFGYYHRFVLEASLRHIVLHGVNVDERICELLDTYTIDELFEGLAPRVTGAGVWLHSSLPKSRTPNGDFDLAIPSDLPKFELQSDLPGAYHAGYDTKNSSLDERGYIHIDSIYAGISSAKPADSSTFNKLEAGLLGIYEAFSILSSLSFFNPDWVGLGAPNALGERSMNLTANMIFYDRAIRLPPAVQPHPELHVGITEWTDLQSRDPSAFCNSFAPLLPPPHLFIAILLTWLTPDELVKHIWLEGSQCPDPVSLHSYLITSLRPAWELLVFRQGVGLSVSTGDGGDGDDNVLDAIDEGSSAGGESVAGADGQAVEKSEGAAAGSTPDAATGAAGE